MKKFLNRMKKAVPFIIPAIIFAVFLGYANGEPVKKTPYTEFQKLVEKKQVKEAVLDKAGGTVTYETKDKKTFVTTHPEFDDFKKELLEKDVKVETVTPGGGIQSFLPYLQLLLVGLLIYIFYRQLKPQAGGVKGAQVTKKSPVKFSDVAGYAEVKKDVENVVSFLKEPKKYLDRGARMPKGMILHGPPGTGKTLIAKAIAGEAGVPFYSVSGSDFIEKFVGVGAQRIRGLFEEAKKNAPSIIFIDEIDAIGGKRGGQSNSEETQTINALLTQMDGFAQDSGILVIATTNRISMLDDALVRPGRFDMHVTVPLPFTAEERLEIIQVHSKNKVYADDVDLMALAKDWMGFSGADIESTINSAAILSVDTGKDMIDMECFLESTDRRVLGGHLKKTSQKDRHTQELELVAYHEAGHAVAGKLLDSGADVRRVTILASTTGAGGITFINPRKMGLHTISEMESDVKVSYAGRIAELLLFKDEKLVTTGASSDIEQATAKIKQMISTYGMTKEVGMLNLDMLGVDKGTMVKLATELSNRLYNETHELLTANWDKVIRVAEALLEKETILEDELDRLMEDPAPAKEVVVDLGSEMVELEKETDSKASPGTELIKKPVAVEAIEETY